MIGYLINLGAQFRWQDIVDFIVVAYIIYRFLLLIKGTRAVQMLTGFGIIIIVFLLAQKLEFFMLHWILNQFVTALVLILIILFQDDIRRALAHVGRNPFFSAISRIEETQLVDELIKAVNSLIQKKVGALIAIERETGLRNYIEMGTEIDSKVNAELITSIFLPYSPLHDGAVIIQKGRITTAGCFFPLSRNPHIMKTLGTRHRAGIGLTEETDALVIIVSEETAEASLAISGKIKKNVDNLTLRKLLAQLLGVEKKVLSNEETIQTNI